MIRLALAAVLAALAGAAHAQATAGFRDWWAACDEQRTCWAYGFAEDGADTLAFVRIGRGGAAAAEPTLLLGAGRWEGEAGPPTTSLRLSVDGALGPTLTARTDEAGWYVARIDDPTAARRAIVALRNGRALQLLVDAQGRGWRRAPFEPPPAEGEDMWVTTGAFDPATRTLSAWAKGRGLGDCGVMSDWVWTGGAFVLVEETMMGECRGVPQAYWPTTVKADVRR